jgi:Ran GTPase-activating protein (RanGAP) involved in mRNA processing and transport
MMHIGGLSSLTTPQLQQLLGFASSVIVDGGGAQLVELVVDAMASLERPCPAQKLIFYNARLSAAHATALYGVLKHPGSAITSLVLSNIPLTSTAVTTLATALCHGHGKLEQLVLEACSVGNAGAAAIAEALVHSQVLWKLDLSQNHIGDGAAAALAQALVASGSLRVLSLGGNALSDRGVVSFVAPAVERAPPQLESVVLRGMARISPVGRDALQHAATNRFARRGAVLLD